MTDLKYSILEVLYNAPYRQERKINLLNRNFATPMLTRYAIDELIAVRYIEPKIGSDMLVLTSNGAIAYENAQEERRNQAESKRQYRFNKKTTIISLIVAALTTAIALVEFVLLLFKCP